MSTVARLSIDEYEKMIDNGVFDHNRRIELIRGELRQMSPIGVPHEYAVDELSEWSFDNAPRDRVRVRNQESVGLPALDSVPEPDVAWVKRLDYSKRRPIADDVLLIVEVADSSLSYDRGEKSELYAEVGICDYWIVNVKGRCIEVRRSPLGSTFSDIQFYGEGEVVSPLHFPQIELQVSSVMAG
ncbi:MAG: Uma2 family endonuclease [Planctomycetota bacterium]